jgi:hypothetical protein
LDRFLAELWRVCARTCHALFLLRSCTGQPYWVPVRDLRGASLRAAVGPPPARDQDNDVLHEEQLLLAGATAHPAELQHLRWLTADDFTSELHGRIYQCLTALTHRGEAIDPITVLWEAQHRGLLSPHITAPGLLTMLSQPTTTPEYWAERTLQRAVLTTAHTTAHTIQTYTDDPANTPQQLLTGSRRALADLNALRTRWHATQPRPPTASGPDPPHTPSPGTKLGAPRLRSTTAPAFTPSTLPGTSTRPTR